MPGQRSRSARAVQVLSEQAGGHREVGQLTLAKVIKGMSQVIRCHALQSHKGGAWQGDRGALATGWALVGWW